MFALSTAWLATTTDSGHEMVQQARALGFEWLELHHSLKATTVRELMIEKQQGTIKVSSLHNYCPAVQGLKYGEANPEPYRLSCLNTFSRRAAIKNTLTTLDFAQRFEAQAVVLHCGWTNLGPEAGRLAHLFLEGQSETPAYQQLKDQFIKKREKHSRRHLHRLYRSLDVLIPEAERRGLKLGLENRYFPSEIPLFSEFIKIFEHYDTPVLGYWHDCGHAQVQQNLGFTPQKEYLEAFGERLIGVHIHDVIGLDDHKVPLQGVMDFSALTPYMKPDVLKVFECTVPAPAEAVQQGLDAIREMFA